MVFVGRNREYLQPYTGELIMEERRPERKNTQAKYSIICVLLTTRETEAGGSLEPMSSRITWTTHLGPN